MTDAQRPVNKSAPNEVLPLIQAAPSLAVPADGASGDVVAAEPVELRDVHRQFAGFHEGYVSRYIELADTKATWTFAVASGLLAYVFGDDASRQALVGSVWTFKFVLLGATSFLLILTGILSFLVIAPRLRTSGEGIVYFGAVADRKSADEYVRFVGSKSEAELTDARIRHCYDLSRVCSRKYQRLRAAIWFGVPGLVGILIYLLTK